jgi:hypothetical protein
MQMDDIQRRPDGIARFQGAYTEIAAAETA